MIDKLHTSWIVMQDGVVRPTRTATMDFTDAWYQRRIPPSHRRADKNALFLSLLDNNHGTVCLIELRTGRKEPGVLVYEWLTAMNQY
jgi:hypothetical protein